MRETTSENSADWVGFSLKSILAILVGIVLFIWYVHALLFGDNSLAVLNHLQQTEAHLRSQSQSLKLSNQKLQKKYFELIQLNSD